VGTPNVFKGVFYGWWVLLACIVYHAVGAGLYFYGFSVFYTPILLEFGWSSAVTSGAFSLSRLEGGLEGPLIGWLVDRWGARKLLFLGVLLTSLGFIAMTYVNSIFLLYLVYGGFLSIGWNTGFTHSMTALIANWFIKRRSRAMSLYAIAAGVGGAVLVPILAKSISSIGWRMTAVICGAGFFVVGLPLAFIVRNKPEDMRLLPDGISINLIEKFEDVETKSDLSSQFSAESIALEADFTIGEALRSRTFWTLMLAESFRSFLLGSIVLHQIPYLVSIGVSQETAASILGLMITISIPGRLVFGTLGDFYSKRKLLVSAMALQTLGVFILSQATGVAHAYAFITFYGIAYGGAIPLLYAFRGELFGRKRYATISGILAPFRMVGSVVGPIFAGYIYDVYHDYKLAFYVFTLLALLSAVSFIFVKSEDKRSNANSF